MDWETRKELENFVDGMVNPDHEIESITIVTRHKRFKNSRKERKLVSSNKTSGVLTTIQAELKCWIMSQIM